MLTRLAQIERRPTSVCCQAVVVCVLLMMFFMQFSMIKHSLEHMGGASRVAVSPVKQGMASAPVQVSDAARHHDAPFSTTCYKCLEEQAHAFALPSALNTSLVVTADVAQWQGLAFNLVFLAPERANQRGPPHLS
jgi:hypothetical protein